MSSSLLRSQEGLRYCSAFTCCSQTPECNGPFALPHHKPHSFHCWDKGRLSSRFGDEPVADGARNGAQPDTGAANKAKCFPSPAGSACVGPTLHWLLALVRMLLACGGLQPRTVSPVWQVLYACRHCQKRWGFICAWAAAGLWEREPGKIRNCEVQHVSLHPAPSLGTNTVQISNVRERHTSQIVLWFQELIMFSRKQSCSPSSAAGRAVAASSHC